MNEAKTATFSIRIDKNILKEISKEAKTRKRSVNWIISEKLELAYTKKD